MSCFICGGRDFSIEFSGRAVERHHLARCRDCGVVIARPENPAEMMDYSDYGNYLVDQNYDCNHLEMTRRAHSRLLKEIRAGHGRSILDVGAGAGYFVKIASDMGFYAVGIEPSEKLRAFACTAFNIRLYANLDDIEDHFDVVSMFDVIEHIPAEMHKATMMRVLSKLKPGGLMVGNTPNYCSVNILISKEMDPAVWPPSHCCYFTLHCIDNYFHSFGLEQRSLYTKGFRSFRSDKGNLSFLERPTKSHLLKIGLIIPIKVILRIISILTSPLGLGYQIYFKYQKPKLDKPGPK